MPSNGSLPRVGNEFTPVAADRLELGEGIRLLDDGRIVLVDILSGRLFSLPHDSDAALIPLAHLDQPLGAVSPIAGADGFLAATGTGFARLGADGALLSTTEVPDLPPQPRRRMNDAVCDTRGRMWAGTMAYDATANAGALHRLDHDGKVTTVVEGLTVTVPSGPVAVTTASVPGSGTLTTSWSACSGASEFSTRTGPDTS